MRAGHRCLGRLQGALACWRCGEEEGLSHSLGRIMTGELLHCLSVSKPIASAQSIDAVRPSSRAQTQAQARQHRKSPTRYHGNKYNGARTILDTRPRASALLLLHVLLGVYGRGSLLPLGAHRASAIANSGSLCLHLASVLRCVPGGHGEVSRALQEFWRGDKAAARQRGRGIGSGEST